MSSAAVVCVRYQGEIVLRNDDAKVYVEPGEIVVVRMGRTDHSQSLQLADKLMPVRVLGHDGLGQLLSPASGLEHFMPAPLAVLTFCRDDLGWYSRDIHERNVAWRGAEVPDEFQVYVEGELLRDSHSSEFEEVRDAALRLQERGALDVEVRFVERSRCLPKWWTTSIVVPLATAVREAFEGGVRKVYLDLPGRSMVRAGRQPCAGGKS